MFAYRPEQWDALESYAIDWCRDSGLGGVLKYVNDEMCHAWRLFFQLELDKATADELDDSLGYTLVWAGRDAAFGAYNALLIAAHDAGRGDVWEAICKWGHYGPFY